MLKQICPCCGKNKHGSQVLFQIHTKSCKVYSTFACKSSNGYECLICPFKNKLQQRVLGHIRKIHENDPSVLKYLSNQKSYSKTDTGFPDSPIELDEKYGFYKLRYVI